MSTTSTNPGERTAAELEREVDRERSELAHTIEELQDRLSVGSVIDQVVGAVSRHGGDVGRNLGRTVRDNPLPLILTGVGLAWLMASSGEREPRLPRYREEDDWDSPRDRSLAAPDYGTDRFGAASDTDPMVSGSVYGDPYYADSEAGAYETTGTAPLGSDRSAGYDASAGSESSSGPGVRERAAAAAGGVSASASAAAGRVSGTATGAYESARERAARLRDSASHLRDSAGRRLHDASDRAARGYHTTQERMWAAADEARRWSDRNRRVVQDSLEDAIEEQPLVLGALALAVGAAVGGALPRTRTEDEWLGAESDRLKRAARETAERQAEKAMAVAGAVVDEGTKMADEAVSELDRRSPDGRSAVKSAEEAAKNAGERLKHAAEEEAKRQDSKEGPTKEGPTTA